MSIIALLFGVQNYGLLFSLTIPKNNEIRTSLFVGICGVIVSLRHCHLKIRPCVRMETILLGDCEYSYFIFLQ